MKRMVISMVIFIAGANINVYHAPLNRAKQSIYDPACNMNTTRKETPEQADGKLLPDPDGEEIYAGKK